MLGALLCGAVATRLAARNTHGLLPAYWMNICHGLSTMHGN